MVFQDHRSNIIKHGRLHVVPSIFNVEDICLTAATKTCHFIFLLSVLKLQMSVKRLSYVNSAKLFCLIAEN